jgi:hypothetical protein
MIVFNVEQGTPEWHRSRAGKITASMFAEVRKRLKSGPRKGMHSLAADQYAFRLAFERRTGRVLGAEQFDTWAMKRGKELEAEARLAHEDAINELIQHCGFACTDDELYGASADGFVGEDGVAEYKCFVSPEKIKSILIDRDLSDVMDQVQGQLWITDRKWAHFCLFVPDLEEEALTIFEVERDDAYIESLVADLREFNDVVQSYSRPLLDRQKGIIKVPAAMERAA